MLIVARVLSLICILERVQLCLHSLLVHFAAPCLSAGRQVCVLESNESVGHLLAVLSPRFSKLLVELQVEEALEDR